MRADQTGAPHGQRHGRTDMTDADEGDAVKHDGLAFAPPTFAGFLAMAPFHECREGIQHRRRVLVVAEGDAQMIGQTIVVHAPDDDALALEKGIRRRRGLRPALGNSGSTKLPRCRRTAFRPSPRKRCSATFIHLALWACAAADMRLIAHRRGTGGLRRHARR